MRLVRMTCRILITLIIILYCTEALYKTVDITEYPFIAMIITLENGTDVSKTCGGYVLTTRLIVTVAQCFNDDGSFSFALFVGVNATDDLVKIEKWILHPYYSSETDHRHNEIALVRTETEIDPARTGYLPLIPEDSLVNDMWCVMVGWKIDSLNFVGQKVFTLKSQKIKESLEKLYTVPKNVISIIQCKALLNILDKSIVLDQSYLCIKDDLDFEENQNYGTLGSPFFCTTRDELAITYVVGLKRKHGDVETGSPELYINLRSYGAYINRIIADPDSKPIIYFCEIRVCGKKYNTYGEYCVLGDKSGCIHTNRKIKHFFPKSNALPVMLSYSLNLYSMFINVFLLFS